VLRFLLFWLFGDGDGHVQSLIISAVLLILGFQVWVVAIVADLISVNRRLSEEILYTLKKHILPLWQEVEDTSGKTPPMHLPATEKISKVM
jgi:hypothetical protein